MAKRARLADGTVLTFPDETPDSVIDQVVAQHVAGNVQAAPQTNAHGNPFGFLRGVADVGVASLAKLGDQAIRLGEGLGTGIGQRAAGGTFGEGYKEGHAGETIIPPSMTEPTTPEGKNITNAIASVPGVKTLGEITNNVGAGIERIGGPELGPAMRDTAGVVAGVLGAKLPGPGRPATAATAAVNAAERAGYRAPLTTPLGKGAYVGSSVDRGAASLAGGEAVNSRVAVMNQEVTDGLAARAAKIGEDSSSMNPANVKAATDAANNAYAKLKALDIRVPLNTQAYYNGVVNLNRRVKGFDDLPHAQVEALQNVLLTAHPTIPNVIDKVLDLRSRAYDAFRSGDRVYGTALREGADLLDDALNDFLSRAAQSATNPNLRAQLSRLYPAYVQARRELATLHDVRDAMNPTTGTIDAKTIADIVNDRPAGRLTDPHLKQIADAYNALGPDGMRNIARAAKIAGRPLTATDAMIGAAAGANAGAAMGGGATGSMAGAVIGVLAPAVSRGLLRQYALRTPGGAIDMGGAGVRLAGRGAVASQLLPTDKQQ